MILDRPIAMTIRRLPALAALAVCLLGARPAAAQYQDWLLAMDYDKLVAALGANAPNGASVAVSQIEAPSPNGFFLPAATFPDYLGQPGGDVQFTNRSPSAGSGTSNHATMTVGRFIYGNDFGAARGVTDVSNYEVNDWLQKLNNFNPDATFNPVGGNPFSQDPLKHLTPTTGVPQKPYDVENDSWIGSFGGGGDAPYLRRLDYRIDRDETTVAVGLNNNGANAGDAGGATDASPSMAHPNLLASAYNVIAVGRTDGKHSRGLTSAEYGAGRIKPDLVAKTLATSSTTAVVTSAAAVLKQSGAGTDATRSEVMKATLLAGATKEEFASYVEPSSGFANPWDRTETRPLDDVFGAGELNIWNSYRIQLGGQHAGGAMTPGAVPSYGWDYENLKGDASTNSMKYNIVVPEGTVANNLSVILAWNVTVADLDSNNSVFSPQESLKDLNLEIIASNGGVLPSGTISRSRSAVDNVEHIWIPGLLTAGTYTLDVSALSGAINWDYGLAWRTSTSRLIASADFNDDGEVDGADLLSWQQNLGTLVNASHAKGDADGDGDVDAADLDVFDAQLITPPPEVLIVRAASSALRSSIHTIPEPGSVTLAMLAGGAVASIGRARRRSR